MVPQPFGGRHRQSCGDLRPIHITLMTEVEQGRVRLCGRQRGDACVFHARIIPRMVSPDKRYAELINDDDKLLESSFLVPTASLGEVAATVRASEPA
jgi:hypothetical protein